MKKQTIILTLFLDAIEITTMASQKDLFNSQDSEEEINNGERHMEEVQGAEGEQEVGDIEVEEPNDYNPATKKTIQFKEGELAIIVDHLDNNYESLFGHGRTHEYVRLKKKAWKALIEEVNNWNKSQGTGVIRGEKSIKQKIQNLMYRSE